MIKTVFSMTTGNESGLPFYVKGIGIQRNQEHILRPSGFPDYHWAHCTRGEGKLLISGNEYRIPKNSGFFFYPEFPHEYYSVQEPWEICWLTFNGSSLPFVLECLGFNSWNVFAIANMQSIDLVLGNIYLSLTSENPDKVVECSSLLYHFLITAKNNIVSGSSMYDSSRHKRLQPLINYLEKNYAEYTSIEEMAEIVGFTPSHLCRLFKQTYNMSPFKYLTHIRIKKAKEFFVAFPELTVKAVAIKVGYNDASYFCSVFKEYEGATPLEFKRIHGLV